MKEWEINFNMLGRFTPFHFLNSGGWKLRILVAAILRFWFAPIFPSMEYVWYVFYFTRINRG